jgi:hypothetical protein
MAMGIGGRVHHIQIQGAKEMIKAYWSIWALFLASALVLLALGLFGPVTLVVYGFLAFGLVFAGMICVLPIMAHEVHEHDIEAHHVEPLKPVETPQTAPAFGVLKSA